MNGILSQGLFTIAYIFNVKICILLKKLILKLLTVNTSIYVNFDPLPRVNIYRG
jgi:hypothetical protein